MATFAYKVNSAAKEQLILIETSDSGGLPRNASIGLVQKAAKELAEQLEPLSAVAETIRNALMTGNTPADLEVEFGLELGGQGGIPKILEGSAKANFKIKIKWVNDARVKQ